jgi:hypothetical protein
MLRAKPLTLLVALATVTVGLAVPSAIPAYAAACSATKTTTLNLRGSTETWVSLVAAQEDGSKPHLIYMDTKRSISLGAPTVTITTCKSPKTGKWSVLVASFANHMTDLKVYENNSGVVQAEPVDGTLNYGVGIFAKGVTKKSQIRVRLRKCTQDPAPLSALGVAHGVLSLPLPIPFGYAVGAWIAEKALPAAPSGKFHCGDLGTKDLKFSISSSGKVKVTTTGVHGTATVTDKPFACYYREVCTHTTTDEVIVRKP